VDRDDHGTRALRILKFNLRWEPLDPLVDSRLHQIDHIDPGEDLHRAEWRHALRAVIGELRPNTRNSSGCYWPTRNCRIRKISLRLGIPLGSIGPTRARCLEQLRGSLILHAVSDAV